jgi:hypothetical protein
MNLAAIRSYFFAQKWPTLFLSVVYFLFSLLLIFMLPKSKSGKGLSDGYQLSAKTVKHSLKTSATRREMNFTVGVIVLISAWFLVYVKASGKAGRVFSFSDAAPPLNNQHNYSLHCCWRI